MGDNDVKGGAVTLTARDQLAAQALMTVAARFQLIPGVDSEKMLAESAYRMADAMLAVRGEANIPAFAFGGKDWFKASMSQILRSLSMQAGVWMVNNPRGTTDERALHAAGWMLETLSILLQIVFSDAAGEGGNAAATLAKCYEDMRRAAAQAFPLRNRNG